MAKKTAAQIRRNEKRAEARGESYNPPTPNPISKNRQEEEEKKRDTKSDKNTIKNKNKKEHRKEEIGKAKTAIKYLALIADIETNAELKSKERRSAKRRAEAIACEESKVENIQELLDWFEDTKKTDDHIKALADGKNANKKRKKENNEEGDDNVTGGEKKKNNPYILFIGQIPFDATSDDVFKHFQQFMGKKVITSDTLKIRIPSPTDDSTEASKLESVIDNEGDEMNKPMTEMPTDNSKKNKKLKTNKGYAFCEFLEPELMYECLKLHHTSLNGRRINVLRCAGGGKKARIETQKNRQKEQDEYLSTTIDNIIQGYVDNGDLKAGELDTGAILLCKRRSAATVTDAIQEYVKERGEDELENPSSYFTKIMCRVTEESVGAGGRRENSGGRGMNRGRGGRGMDRGRGGGRGRGRGRGRADSARSFEREAPDFMNSSLFSKAGVDMQNRSSLNKPNTLSNIFPSMMRRGRGRGRGGYM